MSEVSQLSVVQTMDAVIAEQDFRYVCYGGPFIERRQDSFSLDYYPYRDYDGDYGSRCLVEIDFSVSHRVSITLHITSELEHLLHGIVPDGVISLQFSTVDSQSVSRSKTFVRKVFKRVISHRNRRINGAARKIQRAWRRAIANPKYKLCRRRLLREFDDMIDYMMSVLVTYFVY